jgi:hypothetical protein
VKGSKEAARVTKTRWIRGTRAAGLTGLLLIGAARCAGEGSTTMVLSAPPSGWQAQLSREREEKDQRFRTGPDTPLLSEDVASFKGLEYWAPDPAYRFAGRIERYPSAERFTILSTTGKKRPCERYGWLSFELRGKKCRLQVYRLLDVGDHPGVEGLFLPFTDETTGRESYPAGRYVDLEGPGDGPYVLDFNRAYNPLCAYGAPERYACPVTPSENRLAVRLEAGERGYKRHGGAS